MLAIERRLILGQALAVGLSCASCSYGTDPDERADYVIYYEGQSTTLDPAATATIARAARFALQKSLAVVVAGFADDPGAPEANQIQSRIRAQLVADALLHDGIARDRIELTPRRALGGDPAVESRRVDIRLGA